MPRPESFEFYFQPTTPRKAGIAFCAPILPGKADAAVAFGKQVVGPRNKEMSESRRRLGVTVEVVTLMRTPQGDAVAVYLEGDDPVRANKEFAASQSPFDKWFKEELAALSPVDFNQPLPPIKTIHTWLD